VTNYYEAVPSNALERILWLEADRMRALKVDDENLKNQRDVVKEEVRVNVMNQPYGGFPWLDMPPVAFRNWANAHNFYGDFADLDAADLRDVQAFFKSYYVPNNAVLLVLGDVKAEEGIALARKYLGDIPADRRRPLPIPASPNRKKSGAATLKKNSEHCPRWPSVTQYRKDAPQIGARWRCWIKRCKADGRGEFTASWFSRSRLPSRPAAVLTTSSATTANADDHAHFATSRNIRAKRLSRHLTT